MRRGSAGGPSVPRDHGRDRQASGHRGAETHFGSDDSGGLRLHRSCRRYLIRSYHATI